MKRLFAAAIGFIAIMLTVAGCTGRPPVLNDDGWITLLDGSEESLSRNWDRVGTANWRIYRGSAVADAQTAKGSSFLVSKNNYTDFQVRVEFWASHDANSGVYMRCADRKKITDTSCYEANIFDQRPDPLFGTGAIMHITPVNPMPKAGGKWNTYEITVRGNQITVWLNGHYTAEARDNKLKSGPIALQYGRGEVRFRKVQIKPI
jgi:hypothetical protein